MVSKDDLLERIDREREYQRKLNVGTEEYDASGKRLNELNDRLAKIEQFEAEMACKAKEFEGELKRRDKQATEELIKLLIELGVDLSKYTIMYVVGFQATKVILHWETTGTVTTMAKGWVTNLLLPKKF